MSPILLIAGASVRAAAWSAARAGYLPVAADRFGDADLSSLAQATRLDSYPDGLVDWLKSAPMAPWLYTGALENRPELVDCMAQQRELLGNSGDVLRHVRDPLAVSKTLGTTDMKAPLVSLSTQDASPDQFWLKKPIRSAGGFRICPHRQNGEPLGDFYLQQRIDGMSCSAVCVAASGRAALLGATEQLIGADWTGAHGFVYCGSVGPLELSAFHRDRFERLANLFANRFRLQGLFGIDAILTESEVWPVEINPRYTASVEILERSLGISCITCHVQACQKGVLPDTPKHQAQPYPNDQGRENRQCRAWGKAILYAERALTANAEFHQRVRSAADTQPWPLVADIPLEGTQIPIGAPITTVFAVADQHQSVLTALRHRADEVKGWLATGRQSFE